LFLGTIDEQSQFKVSHRPRLYRKHQYPFELCDFPIPGNLSDKENVCSRIITTQEREEDIARQRSPITKGMFVAMADKAKSLDKDSIKSVIFNWLCFIRITGLQVAEYAQTTQTSVNVHEYPSGKTVTKAFIANDWKFYDKKAKSSMHLVLSVCQPKSRSLLEFKRIDKMAVSHHHI
jgi:hypothetical protein